MNPNFSILITIFSLMPAIIFVIIFKILLTIIKRGKRKFTEDIHEENRKFHGDRKLDTDTLASEIKRIINEEREKEKNKKNSKEESKKIKENILIDKDPKLFQKELKEKLLESRKLKNQDKKNSKEENLSETYNLENTYNLSKTYNLEKDSDKIIDSEFIKECESDQIFYEDESSENINLNFLDFGVEDLPKIIVYKEIFDKPLSLR